MAFFVLHRITRKDRKFTVSCIVIHPSSVVLFYTTTPESCFSALYHLQESFSDYFFRINQKKEVSLQKQMGRKINIIAIPSLF